MIAGSDGTVPERRPDDDHVRAKLAEDLAARTARHGGDRSIGDDGNRDYGPGTGGGGLEDRIAFGADGQAKTRILDIAPGKDFGARRRGGKDRRPNLEI